MKLGFLYAGQGSQHPRMGQDLYEAFPEFAAVIDGAKPGFDLKEVSFTDKAGVLNQTRYTQPCMVAFAVGMTEILMKRGICPDMAAGLSLGEYSALFAAGVFDAQTAIQTVAFRGKVMEEAAAGHDSAMMAVLGLDREKLQSAVAEASENGCVVIANYNCPGQLVIGGDSAAVTLAAEKAKALGARRCLPLKVSGPFHTPLMHPAGDALNAYFRNIAFGEMRIPVVFNCLGREKTADEHIPDLLVRQVQHSVLMEDSIRCMASFGVDTIIEIGPGKVLSGFVKKTAPEITVYAAETVEDVNAIAEALK